VITPSTLGQVSLEAGDAVVLRGTFTADQALDILQTPHLQVYGGTLQAQEGTASLSLGQGAQLYGVTFDGDFNLSGMETSFQRCYFINGRQQLPSGAQINQSVLRDVVISADTTLGWLNQLHVERAELPSFQSLTHSLVVDSSIGTGSFQVVRDNKIMRSFILMDSDGAHFVDNHCDQSFMTLPTGHSGSLVVRGNKFQGLITGEAQLLHIGASGSQARTVSVENNHFWMQSGQYGIQVTGDVEGSFKLATLSIQGNHFYRGAGAVEHTSNLYTLISSNILRDTPMGTSATSSRFVQNNASF
jgi:hypothetical protein